jgi:hypothetical protein
MVVVPGREPAFRNQSFVHIGRSASVVLRFIELCQWLYRGQMYLWA